MSPRKSPTTTRLSGEDRRELVLAAAMRAFARSGYAGTSTDAVAREAGVSQPYVVRIFGTKLDLFLEVFTMATDRIGEAFEQVLAEGPFDPESEADWERMGMAYTGLLADRDFLLVMMHGFSAAGVPEIGARARVGMADIFEILKRTGAGDEEVRDFVAHGMLLNVMIAIRAPEHVAEAGTLAQLTVCAFGEALEVVS
ncbi:TetR/AcrR family transcriptional regulator [Nocardioides sp.]|uniref:TetR/AcrR family transcriptional regulator n=1 Tax=Nocardioides sp. TaxID=35761 RepID=UPI003D0C8D3D